MYIKEKNIVFIRFGTVPSSVSGIYLGGLGTSSPQIRGRLPFQKKQLKIVTSKEWGVGIGKNCKRENSRRIM